MRLDTYLKNNGYFDTRNKAIIEIKNGNIYVNSEKITKSSYNIKENDKVEVKGNYLRYVSKGGLKLEKALDSFNINLSNKNMLDIGSSTGGFCDCAIKNKINSIIAVDTGSNQMVKFLRTNPIITLYEETDFRNMDIKLFNNIDIVTIDVSFVSVKKLISNISKISSCKEIVLLIKPQFECGKEIADKYKGVPLNKRIHVDIINNIINEFKNINYYLNGIAYSPIKGGSGNIEYLAYFIKDNVNYTYDINKLVNDTFNKLL